MYKKAVARIYADFIAPDPNMNVLWMDLSADPYGSIIKYWDGDSYSPISGGGSGSGDMLKSIYDSNNNGIVDNAERLGGQFPREFAQSTHTHSLASLSERNYNSLTNKPDLSLKVDKVDGYGLSQQNYTLSEKKKLESLENSKFAGKFTSFSDLQMVTGGPGSYAYVDQGIGLDVIEYIWDESDFIWVIAQGNVHTETPTTVKQKYESNPDTNAYTDAEKSKVANLSGVNTGDQDLSGLQQALVSGSNIKTLNNQSLLGAGNLDTGAAGHDILDSTTTFSRRSKLSFLGNVSVADNEAGDVTEVTVTGVDDAFDVPYGSTNVGDALDTILDEISVPPTYKYPTSALTLSPDTTSYELGTSINLAITQSFSKNDGGAKISETGLRAQSAYSVSGASDSFTGGVTYAQGPIKNTNLGIPYPTGRIPAGTTVSPTKYIYGYRNMFYGVSLPATTSAEVRALGNSYLNPVDGTARPLAIPAGATSVAFCYPKALGLAATIKDSLNIDIKSAFTITEVDVNGANNYAKATYYCYVFTPPSPFAQSNTYTITI